MGSSFSLSQYSEWISKRSAVTGHNHPVWGDLQTEISRSCRDQISATVGVAPPTPVEPNQLKYMAYEVITSGARGIRFRSHSRLDATDPSSRLRSKMLQWLNRHLDQIGPWIAGGVLVQSRNRPTNEIVITPIRTARSQLLLVQRPTGMEQHYAGDVGLATVMFDNEAASKTDRAYQIAEHALIPMAQQRDHVGSQIQINDCPSTAAIVTTHDPTIVSNLHQTFQAMGQTSVQMKTELIQQWLAITQLVQAQTEAEGQGSPVVNGAVMEALNALRKAESLINGGSADSGARFLAVADQRLAVARRELLSVPLRQFQSKTSSALLMHISLVPLHWRIANQLASQSWNPNALAGGDFEDLEHMTRNGWENRRVNVDGLQTKVELARDARVDGTYGLKMSVLGQPHNGLIDSTPLWIASGRIPVNSGQLVRIHGWVKIDTAISNSDDGLIISDSIGGKELAERIPMTDGWQEFALYRASKNNSNISVKFELTGVGEVMLDEVTIRTIQLPSTHRQARK